MDLRQLNLIEQAAQVLDYQPCIITGDLQTGAAYRTIRVASHRLLRVAKRLESI